VTNMATDTSTEAPATEAPATEAPVTEAPVTEAPATEAPETEEPATEAPVAGYVTQYKGSVDADFKAMWLSQFDLKAIYTAGTSQRPVDSFRTKIAQVMENVAALGFNTVIIQMRPNADSMYPSEYYPPSSYVVYSYANTFAYDPIEIAIEEAHKCGLYVHGWINPLRGMKTTEITSVDSKYQVKKWWDDTATKGKYVVPFNEMVYLNPAYEDVRQLIIDGAAEIVRKYDVDGVHMDDYFYPTTDGSFDARAYVAYKNEANKAGETAMSLKDWRRDNLNKLVSGIYAAVKAENPNVVFGISPAGDLNKVYDTHCADIKTWCAEEGYIDYICPQVYFGLEHQNFGFVKVCNDWQNIIKTDKVKLIIGVTFSKASTQTDQYAGTGKDEWKNNKDVLKRCVIETGKLDKCAGMAVFCYQHLYDIATGKPKVDVKLERENFVSVFKDFTWFSKD